MGRITKPCPACKTTDHHRQAVDGICSHCEQELAWAVRERARQAVLAPDEITVVTPKVDYAIPSYMPRLGSSPELHNRDRLKRAMHAVIQAVSRPAQAWQHGGRRLPQGFTEWAEGRVMPVAVADAIDELDQSIRVVIDDVGAGSLQQGQNLLMNLAAGAITMDTFNEAGTQRKSR